MRNFTATILLMLVCACAGTSSTPNSVSSQNPTSCNAFDSIPDTRRLRISCQINPQNPEQGRQDMLLFAATEARSRGFNWFRIYDRTEVDANGDRFQFRGNDNLQPDGGQPACDVFSCTNFGALDITDFGNRFDRTPRKSVIFIEIQLGSGQKPAGIKYYDVRELRNNN
jgi:hypothetical protein